jgi:hypothetical protein
MVAFRFIKIMTGKSDDRKMEERSFFCHQFFCQRFLQFEAKRQAAARTMDTTGRILGSREPFAARLTGVVVSPGP